MTTETIQHQRESCSVEESRCLTTSLEDKEVVKIPPPNSESSTTTPSSCTGLRISYRQSSIKYGKMFFFFPL